MKLNQNFTHLQIQLHGESVRSQRPADSVQHLGRACVRSHGGEIGGHPRAARLVSTRCGRRERDVIATLRQRSDNCDAIVALVRYHPHVSILHVCISVDFIVCLLRVAAAVVTRV